MARFSPEFLDELKARVSIAEVVGRRVIWDKRKSVPARGDHWACCPFHGEKSPSFHVDERKGFYHCFGCHESGSAIDFVMKIDGLSFPEAIEMLASHAGMALPERRPDEIVRDRKRAGLGDVMEMAVKTFREALASPEGAEARAYLARRGLAQETIDRFEIGYAPAGDRFTRDPMTRYLVGQGVSLDQLVEVDIAGRRDGDGSVYDRFSHRVMFPIRDPRGRCVAFGGRALSADARAKYLNSRETALFDKGRTLYNFAAARTAASRAGGERQPIVVVEGYMDVIALAEAGIEGAVAPMGTALTENQLALLWRASDEPVMMLDGDAAGRRAAFRAADLALPGLKPGKSLLFAWTPPGLDPDDLVRSEGGVERISQILAEAEPLIDVIWRRETTRGPLDTPERRAGFEKKLREIESLISDEAVRSQYRRTLDDLKKQLFRSISWESRVNKRSPNQSNRSSIRGGGGRWGANPLELGPKPETFEAISKLPKGDRASAEILLFVINHPALILKWEQELLDLDFLNSRLNSVKFAAISFVVDFCDLDESQFGDGIIENYINERCGAGVCDEIRNAVEPWIGSDAHKGIEFSRVEDAFARSLAVLRTNLSSRSELMEYSGYLLDPNYSEDLDPARVRRAQSEISVSMFDNIEDDSEEIYKKTLYDSVDAVERIIADKKKREGHG